MNREKKLEYARKYRRKNRKKINQYYREYFKTYKHKNYNRMYRLRLEAIKECLNYSIVSDHTACDNTLSIFERINDIICGNLDDELLERYEAKKNGKE